MGLPAFCRTGKAHEGKEKPVSLWQRETGSCLEIMVNEACLSGYDTLLCLFVEEVYTVGINSQ